MSCLSSLFIAGDVGLIDKINNRNSLIFYLKYILTYIMTVMSTYSLIFNLKFLPMIFYILNANYFIILTQINLTIKINLLNQKQTKKSRQFAATPPTRSLHGATWKDRASQAGRCL